MEVKDAVKMQATHLLEMGEADRNQPGQFGAGLPKLDWRKALDRLDDALDRALPLLGPLMPAQISAIAALIARAISVADEQVNGPDETTEFP